MVVRWCIQRVDDCGCFLLRLGIRTSKLWMTGLITGHHVLPGLHSTIVQFPPFLLVDHPRLIFRGNHFWDWRDCWSNPHPGLGPTNRPSPPPSSPPVGWVGSNNNTLHPVTSHQDGLRSLFPSITNLATSPSFIYLTSGGRLRHSLHRVSCWVSQCRVQRLCLSVITPSLSQLLRITVNLTNTSRYEVFDLASGRAQLVDSACLIRQESLKERQKSSVRSSSVCGCALTPSQCD